MKRRDFQLILSSLSLSLSPQVPTMSVNMIRGQGQDWTPVVIRKTLKEKQSGLSAAQALAQSKRNGIITTQRKGKEKIKSLVT